MSVDLVIPTFRRVELLGRCLAAVARQRRLPDTLIIASRADDDETNAFLATLVLRCPVIVASVVEPGVIAAMARGVALSTAEIIAFTDDDATPAPDWLLLLEAAFDGVGVGGVGGRDVIPGQEVPLTGQVGVVTRCGKVIGNHHLGSGPARDVSVLKAVNMAFRAEALALPRAGLLRGAGAQVDFELVVCGWARQQGWRLRYDPAIVVGHAGAPRYGPDRRVRPHRSAIFDAAHNSVIGGTFVAPASWRSAAFGILVGTRDRPGLVRLAAAVARGEVEVVRRAPPALAGRVAGVARLASLRRRTTMVVTAERLRNPRPLRVALVAHDIDRRGGMERAFSELVEQLHRHVRLVVVSASLDPELRGLVEWRRVRVPSRPFPLKFVTFFLRAGLALHGQDVDVVQTLGAIVPNRVDVAAVHFCHAGYRRAAGRLATVGAPPARWLNSAVAEALALGAERWMYRPRRLRTLGAVSGGVVQELRTLYPDVPAVLTPNGIDLTTFRPDPDARAHTRADLGVAADVVAALFVGGDWDRKGLPIAIEALALAARQGAPAQLWVIGRGRPARFEELATRLGVGDAVRFLGSRPDIHRFYQAADVLVLPSRYETFSLVVHEAAAAAIPAIACRVSGVEDLVGSDEAGLLVERTPESFASALVRLVHDPELRRRLGQEARRRVAGQTWETAAAASLEVWRRLMPSVTDRGNGWLAATLPPDASGSETHAPA